MRSLLIAAFFPALFPLGALAQPASYNPGMQAGETYALLLGATIVPRAAAERVAARCAAEAPALAESARAAAGEWHKRNAPLEIAAVKLYENVAEGIGFEIGADKFDPMRRKIDETVRAGSTRLAEALFEDGFSARSAAERQATCDNLFKQMREGKLDVAALQPGGFRLIVDGTALLGRWRNLSGTTRLADGTTHQNPPGVRCWSTFSVSTLTTECETSKTGWYSTLSKYMLVGPGEYRAEVIQNQRAPQMVGLRSGAEFRIENDRLVLTTYPPFIRGNPPRAPVKVVGEWERVK